MLGGIIPSITVWGLKIKNIKNWRILPQSFNCLLKFTIYQRLVIWTTHRNKNNNNKKQTNEQTKNKNPPYFGAQFALWNVCFYVKTFFLIGAPLRCGLYATCIPYTIQNWRWNWHVFLVRELTGLLPLTEVLNFNPRPLSCQMVFPWPVAPVRSSVQRPWLRHDMDTNITGPLWGETTGHGRIPLTKRDVGLHKLWINSHMAGYLRRHDVRR